MEDLRKDFGVLWCDFVCIWVHLSAFAGMLCAYEPGRGEQKLTSEKKKRCLKYAQVHKKHKARKSKHVFIFCFFSAAFFTCSV